MNDIAIKARNVSKIYQLYNSPLQMLLSKAGLGGILHKKPREHAALDNVSLEIKRGEKVAMIGRNGAGKSTFLKLISGISEPTFGSLEVNGQIHALLTIGSGFHQDFTGRENAYAYLANQGIAGKRADRIVEEIIEFAEIEDYIDQPLRTYSTGMGVRLMFATSTVIAPDILILDEVLGVGDAYFAQKSYDRMREMAINSGTTLLLVTHDIYSAAKLCERVIWVDRGRILIDGEAREVVAAYENSVKVQEEERLRVKNMKKGTARKRVDLVTAPDTVDSIVAGDSVLIEIKPGNGKYFETSFWLREVTLYSGSEVLAKWQVDDAKQRDAILFEGSQWGEFGSRNECAAISIKDYGNPFQKCALRLELLKDAVTENLAISLDVFSETTVSFLTHCIAEKNNIKLRSQVGSALVGQWQQITVPLEKVSSFLTAEQDFYGTTDILLSNLRCFQDGKETLLFEPEKPWEAQVDYEVKNPDFCGKFEIMIVFQKDGLVTTNRSVLRDITIDNNARRKGFIYFSLPWLPLGRGEYAMSVSATAKNYSENFGIHKFYTIDPEVYCSKIQWLKFKVDNGPAYASQTSVVLRMDYTTNGL